MKRFASWYVAARTSMDFMLVDAPVAETHTHNRESTERQSSPAACPGPHAFFGSMRDADSRDERGHDDSILRFRQPISITGSRPIRRDSARRRLKTRSAAHHGD